MAAIILAVSPIYAQDVQGDVYVEASVDNTNPYVGQQVIYSLKLYDAVGLINPLYQPSNFEGFWRIDIGVVSQTNEQINGRTYNVTTISTALYPTHSEAINIQPSSVILPETVFRAKQTLTANPVSLDVKALPQSNSSAFNGAVGQFTMSASLDRQAVNIGEPVTMTLTVSGTGNIEQLPPPALPDNWRATINAGNFKSQTQNGLIIGTRDYQIVFTPTSTGDQELPAITLNYFDPVDANYKSMSTSPIQIQVSGDTVAAPNLSLDDSEPSLSLKPIGSQATGTTSPLIFIMAGLLPLLGVAAIGYQQWNKTRKAQLEKRIRQQQAAQIAIRNLKALALADSKSSYQVIEKIFNRYLSDKLDMDLKVVKQSNLMQLLTQNGTSENIKSKVQVFVSDIEEGQFSPSAEDIAPQKTEDLVKLLRDIDAEWIVP
ncbi:MAG: BatD family protein [Anaerolineae bacterium]|nr:BatD family protein [Anaerolineae bacterium]